MGGVPPPGANVSAVPVGATSVTSAPHFGQPMILEENSTISIGSTAMPSTLQYHCLSLINSPPINNNSRHPKGVTAMITTVLVCCRVDRLLREELFSHVARRTP